MIELGAAARKLWSLRPDASFLNHGSYGACPIAVLQVQQQLREQMEAHPDAFMARIEPDSPDHAVRDVADSLAGFIGTAGTQIALVENATTGAQTVLNSLPLGPGDQILVTDHQYNSVRLAAEERCRKTGATLVVAHIPLPTTGSEIVQRVLDAAGPGVKLALLDHITSPSALVFPVEQLVSELHRRDILVMLDGAHCMGQIPLGLDSLGADWYIANAHKWLYAPKGSALMYASGGVAPLTRPLVTSHFFAKGFPDAFDYVGTRDYTSWLSIPAALNFFRELGPERVWNHNFRLVLAGSDAMINAGAVPASPIELCAAMRAFILPQKRPAIRADAASLMALLWNRERIQIRCTTLGGNLLLRFCAQAYVGEQELQRLAEALQRHGWPNRA
jgi:isopenicillin-N epimerase